MQTSWQTRTAALACIAASCVAVSAHACPRNADPSLAGAAVGQNMVVNGTPMQIQQVSSPESVATLIERVGKAWAEGGFDVRRQQFGPWEVVSALSPQCLTTLQLTRAPAGTAGFFAIGEPSRHTDRVTLLRRGDIPLVSGAQVVSTVSAKDGQRTSTTTTVVSKRSVNDMRDHYIRALEAAGYGNVRAHEIRRQGSMQRAQIVSGQRANDIVQVVIFEDVGTVAVITQGQAL